VVNRIKKAAMCLMKDKCDIYEKRVVTKNSLTEFERVKVYESVPCAVSAQEYLFGEKATSSDANVSAAAKKVKLFIPPEYELRAGSEVEVMRDGRLEVYKGCGQMKRYLSHSEILMELAHDWA
jgi:hypothetical protein